jgi:hypothetical protein
MTFAKRLERLEREAVCPTCGIHLRPNNPNAWPIDLTILTAEQKVVLHDLLHKQLPPLIYGMPVEEFKKLPQEEKYRLMLNG